MNALQRKTQEYDQVKIPSESVKSRGRSTASITYLDDRRTRQLATRKREDNRKREAYERMLQQRREYEEWKAIDKLYNQPKPNVKASAQQVQRSKGNVAQQAAKSTPQKRKPKYRFVGKKKMQERRQEARGTVNKKSNFAFSQPKKQHNMRVNAGGVAALQRTAIPGFDMNAPGATKLQSSLAVEMNPVKRKEFLSLIAMIIAVFLMLAAVLNMYATQSNAVYQNVQIEKEITELEKTLDKLKKEKASKEDLNSIQNAARDLGMHYPKEKQIVYLPPTNEIPQ